MTKSIYDQLNASGTVAKQRFVETFSGDALDTDRWTSPTTGAMADEVDGGYEISSGSIDFNDINQFAHNGCVAICLMKRAGTGNSYWGLMDTSSASHRAQVFEGTSNTYTQLRTKDGTTLEVTDTNVAVNTNWNNYKLELDGSSVKLNINGVLKATNSTNIPSVALQPVLGEATATTQFRYLEVYNT